MRHVRAEEFGFTRIIEDTVDSLFECRREVITVYASCAFEEEIVRGLESCLMDFACEAGKRVVGRGQCTRKPGNASGRARPFGAAGVMIMGGINGLDAVSGRIHAHNAILRIFLRVSDKKS